MPLPKPCKRCSKKYQPNTKFSKLCDDCITKAIVKASKKRKEMVSKNRKDTQLELIKDEN